LVENEASNVSSGDASTVKTGEIRERADHAALGRIVQHRGANENPIDTAFLYRNVFTQFLWVGESRDEGR
jgi:hypothetical protein